MMRHFSVCRAIGAVFGLFVLAAATPNPEPQDALDSANPTYASESTFQDEMLNSTNTYRSLYGAGTVAWNDTLASFAQDAANSCVFKHTGGPYGENIAQGYASTQDVCQAWGDERFQYSWVDPGFSEATGHFTQLVWKTTTTIGCGRTFCGGSQGWYVVCEYWPRGNVIGDFVNEVGTLGSAASNAVGSPAATTPTRVLQTSAVTTPHIPLFTGAATKKHVGSGMALVGVVGALVAWF